MALEALEILAWIIIGASLIKMLVILISPNSWMNLAKKVYRKPVITSWVAFVLALIVLYFLIDEGIAITQILAVTLFVALLFMVGLSTYIRRIFMKVNLKTVFREQWYYVLIWLVLIVWGIIELLS